MFKNVASQKVIYFAFTTTDNLPKTGDAANLTAYVSKDYGAVTVLADTSATEMDATNAKGYYLFDLAQAETNADTLLFSAKSSTANVSVIGVPAVVFTCPVNFTAFSVDSNGRIDLIKIAGTTQTARDLGASVLLSSGTGTGQLDFTSGVVKGNLTQIVGTSSGATRLDRAARAITLGTVTTGSSTTSVTTSSLAPAASVTDQFKGLILAFDLDTSTAALRGQKTDITASTAGGTLTVTALTTAPASGDTFTIE